MNEISWTIHKAKETPIKTLIVSFFLLAVLLFFLFFYGLLWTLIAILVFFISLNNYFLPIYYTLTEKSIIIDKKIFKFQREWKDFRRYYLTSNGIVLSPFSKKNFLDNFRGLHLLLPKEKDAIINFIKNRFSAINSNPQ